MTRRACLRGIGALALPLFVPAGAWAEGREWRITGYDIPELRVFDQAMEAFMRPRNIRSGALAVARGGRLVLARGYAWDDEGNEVQPTSLFRIASVTKPVTATAVMRLAQERRIELSAPITSLLPLQPAGGRRRDPRFEQITVLHLLQHLGGWDRDRTFDPMFQDAAFSRASRVPLPIALDHIIGAMASQRIDYHPGSTFCYSNFGYALLGRAIERVTGLSYADATQQLVLRPLGVDRMRLGRTRPELRAEGEVTYDSIHRRTTVLDPSGRSVPAPYGGFNLENMDAHGGWLASPVDLLRFTASADPERGVLDADTIAQMFEPPATGVQAAGWYYGCGWEVRPRASGRNTWHSGSLPGTTSLLVRRWDGVEWAAVFNQRDDPADPSSQTYREIDNSLGLAASAVNRWPTHDLFDEY